MTGLLEEAGDNTQTQPGVSSTVASTTPGTVREGQHVWQLMPCHNYSTHHATLAVSSETVYTSPASSSGLLGEGCRQARV